MANPTDLRVIKTRQTIRNALSSLMSEMELSDITITALCSRAQINRSFSPSRRTSTPPWRR